MKYNQAKAKALILSGERKVDHVVYQINGSYEVAIKGKYTGEILATVKYEAEKEEPKKGKKSDKNIPELRDTPDSEILQSNGNV